MLVHINVDESMNIPVRVYKLALQARKELLQLIE
jgi:hypothetical protein